MLKKRYRVVIDFDVEISDITAEQIARGARDRGATAADEVWAQTHRTPPSEADLAALRELQQSLLDDAPRLDLWIKHEVFADLLDESLQEFTYEFDEHEFLKPLIERLSPRARHRLREAMAREEVVEELEPFWSSFQPTAKAVRITEID
jgi:hypothetical protein